jgi:hypothetical protein
MIIILILNNTKIFISFLVGSIISSIGGFFSSLSGIYVFLFGASKLAPW